MKLKNTFKFLLVIGLILLMTILFNTKPVQATGAIVTEGTLTTEILDSVIPTSMKLDIKETELAKAEDMVYKKIEQGLLNHGITLQTVTSGSKLGVWFSFDEESPNIHEITVEWNDTYNKKIALEYTNTSSYNEADAKAVESLFPGKYDDNNIISLGSKLLELGESYENFDKDFLTALNRKANDSTITFVISYYYGKGGESDFGLGGSEGYYVLKNGVYYKHIVAGFSYAAVITVPEEVKDTEEAYIEYALPKVKAYLEKANYTNASKVILKKVEGKENLYKASIDGEDLYPNITIKKAEPTKVEDLTVVQEVKEVELKDLPSTQKINKEKIEIAETNPIVKEIITRAKKIKENVSAEKGNTIVSIIGAVEVNLVDIATGEKGKLAKPTVLTFSVPEEYNGKLAYVLHQKQNKEYEEFKNIKIANGKVSVTVTELSPFVIALQSGEIVDETPKKKDESPKTGDNTIVYVSMLSVISLGGIALLSKKDKE